MPYALCSMLSALCAMLSALCSLRAGKAYILYIAYVK
jgi:hypothetical protein